MYGFQDEDEGEGNKSWPCSFRLRDGTLTKVELVPLCPKEEGRMFRVGDLLTYVKEVGTMRGDEGKGDLGGGELMVGCRSVPYL